MGAPADPKSPPPRRARGDAAPRHDPEGPHAATIAEAGPPAAMLGERLGPYEVVRALGSGGQADVFEVIDPASGERRAAKVLRPEYVDDAQAIARFRREATAARLSHPNLLRIFGVESLLDGRLVLVSELLSGRDLASRLADGRCPVELVYRVGLAAADALGALHAAGVVHRDVKPANLFLGDGQPPEVKVVDFGIAALTEDWDATRLTRSASLLGSPAYMSPEQIRNPHEVGPAADVYSLGATLFHLLVGYPPFAGDNFVQILKSHLQATVPRVLDGRPDAPPALAELIERTLAKDPRARPPDGRALHAALAAAAAGRSLGRPTSSASPPPRPKLYVAPAPATPRAPLPLSVWLALGIAAAVAAAVWARAV